MLSHGVRRLLEWCCCAREANTAGCAATRCFSPLKTTDRKRFAVVAFKPSVVDARVGASGDLEIHLPPREEVDAVLATPKLKVTCDKAPKQAPAFAR